MSELTDALGGVVLLGATIYVIDRVTGKKKKVVIKPSRTRSTVKKTHKKTKKTK